MGHGRLSPPQLDVRTVRLPVALLYWAIGGLLVASLVLSVTGHTAGRARLGAMPGAPQLLAAALATHTPTPTLTPTPAPPGAAPAHDRSIVPTFTPTVPAQRLPTVTPTPPASAAFRLPTPTPATGL